MISKRGEKLFNAPEFLGYIFKMNANPFNKEKNPNGIVNLGVAGSSLSYDLMREKILSICKDEKSFQIENFGYGDFNGEKKLRDVFCEFFKKWVFCVNDQNFDLGGNDFVFMNGGGTAIENFGYFVADENEEVIICSPFYHAFPNDFAYRFKVNVNIVNRSEENKFKFDFEQIENAMKKESTKAFILCNPNNPLGESYAREDLIQLIDLCLKYKVHLLSDEIYCLTVLSNEDSSSSPFVSVYNIVLNETNEEKRRQMEQYVHVMYSLSKDFGMNGYRVGVFFSKNKKLIGCYGCCSYSCACSSYTLELIYNIFRDEVFIERYIKENQRRLAERYHQVREFLAPYEEKGILEVRTPKGTMFIWMKFPQIKNFKKEKDAFEKMFQNGAYMCRGEWFHCMNPGWFRLSYAADSLETIKMALKRAFKAIE